MDRFGIGRSTDVDKHTWANPHAYLTHQFSDNLWGGIGIFSRFGLGNSYPTNWPGRENLKYVSLKTVSLNPNLAFKINDNLSLAVGLEFMYATMLMKKDGDLGKMTGSPLLSVDTTSRCSPGPASPPASTSQRITNSMTNGPQA